MTYVCTEKATISEWLKEIEELKEEVKKWRAIADENEIMLEDRKKVHKENKCLKARVETLENAQPTNPDDIVCDS